MSRSRGWRSPPGIGMRTPESLVRRPVGVPALANRSLFLGTGNDQRKRLANGVVEVVRGYRQRPGMRMKDVAERRFIGPLTPNPYGVTEHPETLDGVLERENGGGRTGRGRVRRGHAGGLETAGMELAKVPAGGRKTAIQGGADDDRAVDAVLGREAVHATQDQAGHKDRHANVTGRAGHGFFSPDGPPQD